MIDGPIEECQSVAAWSAGLQKQWDGDPLAEDPFKLFVNKAANPITLTVAAKDDPKTTRQVKINPIRDESNLLYLDWTETTTPATPAATARCRSRVQRPAPTPATQTGCGTG